MKPQLPKEEFTVTFCDKCGQDDLIREIRRRHFYRSSLCVGGTLKVVTYKRDDATIREARNDEI